MSERKKLTVAYTATGGLIGAVLTTVSFALRGGGIGLTMLLVFAVGGALGALMANLIAIRLNI